MKALKIIAVVLLATLPLIVAASSGSGKTGIVSSEPLACYQVANKLICIDGPLTGDLHCSEVDATTILCTHE